MPDLWRDFWIRETGTGQQVAQLHDRYMMMMVMMIVLLPKYNSCVVKLSDVSWYVCFGVFWIMIWYIYLQMGWHPLAVVQYIYAHKQYIEQHNRNKQYLEQNNLRIRKSADRAPSLLGIFWHLPYDWRKTRKNLRRKMELSQMVPPLK